MDTGITVNMTHSPELSKLMSYQTMKLSEPVFISTLLVFVSD